METIGNIEFKDNSEVFERLWSLSNSAMLSEADRRKYERSLKAYRDFVNQLDYSKEEGRIEGRIEGREEGKYELINILKSKGKSNEETASLFDLPLDYVSNCN